METEFVSIGPCCYTTEYIKNSGLRNHSYPFDYIFSSIEMVNHCINDKFKMFLDLKYISDCNHSFYDKKIKTNLLACHSYHVLGLYKPPVTFPHHNLHIESIYNSMQRKCNRFLDLLNSNKKIFLVYIIKYISLFEFIKEFNEIINLSNSINVNILVIYISELEMSRFECCNNVYIHIIKSDNSINEIFNLYK